MPSNYTPEFQRALRAAQAEARLDGRRRIAPAHLLLAALDPDAAVSALVTAGHPIGPQQPSEESDTGTAAARTVRFLDVEPELLRLTVQTRLRAIRRPRWPARKPGPSFASRRSLEYAVQEARRLKASHIGTEHLLLGLARTWRESLPWGLEFFWDLHRLRLLPDPIWEAMRRPSREKYLVVPEILEEFRLDLPSLRVAAAHQDPSRATLPWSEEVQRAALRAQKEAGIAGAGRVGAEHLWLGLLGDPGVAALFHEGGLSVPILQQHMRAAFRSDAETASTKTRYSPEARRAFAAAERSARAASRRFIDPAHLLTALAGAAPAAPARERAARFLRPAPVSRAEAALARALQEMDVSIEHLRRVLLDSSSTENPLDIETLRTALRGEKDHRVSAFFAPGMAWYALAMIAKWTVGPRATWIIFSGVAMGALPILTLFLPRTSRLRSQVRPLIKPFLFGWVLLLLVLALFAMSIT